LFSVEDVYMNAISQDVALKLCTEISAANRGKWYTFNGLWCWGCVKFSGEIAKRCFANQPDNRGCAQVNARYDRLGPIDHDPQQPPKS